MTAVSDPSPIKVLLVEDNGEDVSIVRELLAEARPGKFLLTAIPRMSTALEKLRQERFHVLILDLTLPDCTGLESFERLTQTVPKTPIVVLTGSEDDAIERQLAARGAHDYLRKRHLEGKLLAAVLTNAAQAI